MNKYAFWGLLCFLLLTFVVASPTSAYIGVSDYYVSVLGDDLNSGFDATPEGAFLTIQHAVNIAVSGDRIHVGSGTYYEAIVVDKNLSLIGNSGDASVGPDPTAPIIDGTECDVNAIRGDCVAIDILSAVNSVKIQGFVFSNWAGNDGGYPFGIGIQSWIPSVSNLTISDNRFTNIDDYAIFVGNGSGMNDNIAITGNIFDNFGREAMNNNPYIIFLYNLQNSNVSNNSFTADSDAQSTTMIYYSAYKGSVGSMVSSNNLISGNTFIDETDQENILLQIESSGGGTASIEDTSIVSNSFQGKLGISKKALNIFSSNPRAFFDQVSVRDNSFSNINEFYLNNRLFSGEQSWTLDTLGNYAFVSDLSADANIIWKTKVSVTACQYSASMNEYWEDGELKTIDGQKYCVGKHVDTEYNLDYIRFLAENEDTIFISKTPAVVVVLPDTPSIAGDAFVNKEESASVEVTIGLNGVFDQGDKIELLLGEESFSNRKIHTITSADLSSGNYKFVLSSGELGDDGDKQLSARSIDMLNGVMPYSEPLEISLDTSDPKITLATGSVAVYKKNGDLFHIAVGVTDAGSGVSGAPLISIGEYVLSAEMSPVDENWKYEWTVSGDEGVSEVWVSANDLAGNTANTKVADFSIDNTAPVLALIGSSSVVLEYNFEYSDLGATVSDNYAVRELQIDSSAIDNQTLGLYTVYYNIDDEAGNSAVEISRTVNVVDTTAPVITLVGNSSITIKVGDDYTEQGASAVDNYDGNLTSNITISGSVNNKVVGVYTVSYTATDAHNNGSKKIRTVTVQNARGAVISSSGGPSGPSSYQSYNPNTGVTTKDEKKMEKIVQKKIAESKKPVPQVLGEKIQARVTQIEQIINDVKELLGKNFEAGLKLRGKTKNLNKENEVQNKYISKFSLGQFKQELKTVLTNFVAYGNRSSEKLGEGERAGVLNSYKEAFGKLPENEEEWSDVMKIANGRWPNKRNEIKEASATTVFEKIYLRKPDMNNQNDNAAVTIISYGLRPDNRNLNSEKNAIKSFQHIYGHAPSATTDWDSVRAIAYSGAKR